MLENFCCRRQQLPIYLQVSCQYLYQNAFLKIVYRQTFYFVWLTFIGTENRVGTSNLSTPSHHPVLLSIRTGILQDDVSYLNHYLFWLIT